MNNPFHPHLAAAACLLAALTCSHAAETDRPETQTFLFIGNSFTYRHELKDIFKALAQQGNPGVNFVTERVTYGGRDLFRHIELCRSQNLLRLSALSDEEIKKSITEMDQLALSDNEPGFYSDYWKSVDSSALRPWEEYEANSGKPKEKKPRGRLKQWTTDRQLIRLAIENQENWMANRGNFPKAWNYLVLQSWQDMKADPETGYLKYAAKFAEIAKSQNTKVVLYVTAPYSQNKTPVTEPIEKERALMEVRLAAGLAEKIGALVVPVPLAVYRLQTNGTDLTLRYKNDGHPNQVGAYLTACLLYAAVFNKSPEGLGLSEVVDTIIVDPENPTNDPDGNPIKRVFTDAERTLLQRTAWETMQAFHKGEY